MVLSRRATALGLIRRYRLHDDLNLHDPIVRLEPLEGAFPPKLDDLARFDAAGLVTPPIGEIDEMNPALVVLHDGLSAYERRHVYAHEVGHAVLGHEGFLRLSRQHDWFADRMEREAWQFAVQLLVPHAVIWTAAEQGWDEWTVAELCQVPIDLLELYPR